MLRWGPEQRVADDHPGIALVADSFSPLAPPGSHKRLRRRRGVWSSILNRLRSEMRLLGPLAVLPRHVIDIDPTCVPLLTLAGPRTVRISAPSSLFEVGPESTHKGGYLLFSTSRSIRPLVHTVPPVFVGRVWIPRQ